MFQLEHNTSEKEFITVSYLILRDKCAHRSILVPGKSISFIKYTIRISVCFELVLFDCIPTRFQQKIDKKGGYRTENNFLSVSELYFHRYSQRDKNLQPTTIAQFHRCIDLKIGRFRALSFVFSVCTLFNERKRIKTYEPQ